MTNEEKNTNSTMPIFFAIIIAGIIISATIVYTNNGNSFNFSNNKETNVKSTALTLEDKLINKAADMGLNKKEFTECLQTRDESEIKKDMEDAKVVGVNGTPSFFVGKSTESGVITAKNISGAQPYDNFKNLIELALKDELKEGKLITTADVKNPTADALGMSEVDFKALSSKDLENINQQYKEYVVEQTNLTQKLTQVSIDDDAVLGDSNAPVTLIEFSDFECPFCKRNFTNTMPSIIKDYIDTGKVKYVFRDMIAVTGHNPVATTEAIAANCAKKLGGDKEYYQMHDYIYQNTKTNGAGL